MATATGERKVEIYGDQAEMLLDEVARALNAAGVPCVLWGEFLWSIHGVPEVILELDLVIPDTKLTAAKQAMMAGRFTWPLVACPDPTKCPSGSSPDRLKPHSAFHMHIEGTSFLRTIYSISLHLQSQTLWFLPPFGASLAKPRECRLPPYLALASDRTALPGNDPCNGGRGAFRSADTVVLVPKAHTLTEALMRIMARDEGKERIATYSAAFVLYMHMYVEDRGFLDVDLLPELFAEVYKVFKTGSPERIQGARQKLRRTLGIPVAANLYR